MIYIKGGKIILLIIIIFFDKNCFGFQNERHWTEKKRLTIDKAVELITVREEFVGFCYKDAYGYSIGYGDFHWCDLKLKEMRFLNKSLINVPDIILLKKIKQTEAIARWRAKKYVIEIYENLEKKDIDIHFDDIELTALISFIYSIGEKKFYKESSLYNIYIKGLLNDNYKFNCIKLRKMFIDWSKIKECKKCKLKTSKGVYNRRITESILFLYRKCAF